MVFGDYINGLSKERPKSEKMLMIDKLCKACCKSAVVVYNWAAGRSVPSALDRRVISGVLSMPEHELFPDMEPGKD